MTGVCGPHGMRPDWMTAGPLKTLLKVCVVWLLFSCILGSKSYLSLLSIVQNVWLKDSIIYYIILYFVVLNCNIYYNWVTLHVKH